MQTFDIYKAGGIIIQNRKVLASRSKKHRALFIQPGGKLEGSETPVESLIRELKEEQGITIEEKDVTFLDTFYAVAAGHEAEQLKLRMDVYIVNTYRGSVAPQAEIEENRWIDSSDIGKIELGSIFEHNIIPKLRELNLID